MAVQKIRTTGRSFETHGVSLILMWDSKIAKSRTVADWMGLLPQSGAIPTPRQ